MLLIQEGLGKGPSCVLALELRSGLDEESLVTPTAFPRGEVHILMGTDSLLVEVRSDVKQHVVNPPAVLLDRQQTERKT